MARLHFDSFIAQRSKHPHQPCGDLITVRRSPRYTTVILADGLGHGIQANISAQFLTSRFIELLQSFSPREALTRLVQGMPPASAAKLHPRAAINCARIRPDGTATILTFDAPAPIFLSPRGASTLPAHIIPIDCGNIEERNALLRRGDGLLLCSDGITQAGLGRQLEARRAPELTLGWGIDGLIKAIPPGPPSQDQEHHLLEEAALRWGKNLGDDLSVCLTMARASRTVSLLTGPPLQRSADRPTVRRFMKSGDARVVCGASTAKMAAKILNTEVEIEQKAHSPITPNRYFIQGIDLVTEGVITLNQVANILTLDPESYAQDSPVSDLSRLLLAADTVHIFMGQAQNQSAGDIAFKQLGLLPRPKIVKRLAAELEAHGKLVIVEEL